MLLARHPLPQLPIFSQGLSFLGSLSLYWVRPVRVHLDDAEIVRQKEEQDKISPGQVCYVIS